MVEQVMRSLLASRAFMRALTALTGTVAACIVVGALFASDLRLSIVSAIILILVLLLLAGLWRTHRRIDSDQ